MIVVILVNTLTLIDQAVYSNHIQFFCETVKEFPKDKFILFTPPRMSIDKARNEAAKMALYLEADYLMFVDDDVLLPLSFNTVKKLIEADKDIVAGSVRIRGFPFNRMAFKYDSKNPLKLDYYNDALDPEHPIVDLDALGFSCCLIKTDILKPMAPPYFITSPNGTEDIYFCIKTTRELNPKPTIALRADIKCTHLLDKEGIDDETVERWTQFYNEDKAKEKPEMFSRGEKYLEDNLKNLEELENFESLR